MRLVLLSALVISLAVRAATAGDAPTADNIRAAVTRSLPFLEREGLAWMRENACMTCHQIPMMVWTASEARRHGLPIDEKNVAVWNEWAVNNALKRATYYNLTNDVFAKLPESELAKDEIAKLEPLKNKRHVLEQDFRDSLAKDLPAEFVAAHGDALLKAAAKGKQGGAGGGENNQYTALLLSGALDTVDDAHATRNQVIEALVKKQNKGGSWNAAGQFLAQQRPKDESAEIATLWSVIALSNQPELPDSAQKAVSKAREWLQKSQPITTTEQLMLRAMLASADEDNTASASRVDELLALQHADGGWGWAKDGAASNPLTTGEMLYGLAYLGRDGSDPAVRKAWQYLLSKQAPDGSWPQSRDVISAEKKKDTAKGDAVYTYWATGWAVVGLLETLP